MTGLQMPQTAPSSRPVDMGVGNNVGSVHITVTT